jgi:hypothetical protein
MVFLIAVFSMNLTPAAPNTAMRRGSNGMALHLAVSDATPRNVIVINFMIFFFDNQKKKIDDL